MKEFNLYILANQKNGTLYIGFTNDLIRRVYERKKNLVDGFTKTYKVHRLVYFERFPTAREAKREKMLKKWKRQWKIELIEQINPGWNELYYDLKQLK